MTVRILPAGVDTPELVIDLDRLYANVLGLQRTLRCSEASGSGRTPRRTRASTSGGCRSRRAQPA